MENLCTFSFHVVADCRGAVKLQVITSDNSDPKYKAFIRVNHMYNDPNTAFNHKTICTLSAIPLCGAQKNKQPSAAPSKVPTRRSAMPVESVKTIPKNPDKIKILPSSTKPSQ